jgi:predicted NodU family carbamoyl transferase
MPERLLVNTSLNLHGQPIVCTPAEARATVNAVGATLLWQR